MGRSTLKIFGCFLILILSFGNAGATILAPAKIQSIDTVIVSVWVKHGGWKLLNFGIGDLNHTVIDTVKETVGSGEGLNIIPASQITSPNRYKPNILEIVFTVTPREVILPNKPPEKVGSITAFISSDYEQQRSGFYDRAVAESVPFIITDDKAANLNEVREAVKHFIPGLLRCVKGVSHDCDPIPPAIPGDNE